MQLLVQNYLDPSRATEIFFAPKRRIFALPKIVRYRNKSGLQYFDVHVCLHRLDGLYRACVQRVWKNQNSSKVMSFLGTDLCGPNMKQIKISCSLSLSCLVLHTVYSFSIH